MGTVTFLLPNQSDSVKFSKMIADRVIQNISYTICGNICHKKLCRLQDKTSNKPLQFSSKKILKIAK